MLPVIFSVGPVTIYSFGLFLFLGFISALFIIWKRSREEHYDEEKIYDAVLFTALTALIGARAIYIIFHSEFFATNILSWINLIGQPGLSLMGALIGGGIGLAIKTKTQKWDFFALADIFVLGVNLMLFFGWIGAFLNGSGVGKPTNSFLGVTFTGLYDKRHPVQLYATILYLFLFLFLWWSEGKYRTFEWYKASKSSTQSGFLTFSFFIFSGIIGLFISSLMPINLLLLGVKPESWLWATLTLIGLMGLYWRSGRALGADWLSLRQVVNSKDKNIDLRKQKRKVPLELGKDILEK